MNNSDFAALIPSLKLRCPDCNKIIRVSGNDRLRFEMSNYTRMKCPYCKHENAIKAFTFKTILDTLKESSLPFKEIIIKGTTFEILGERNSKKYPIVAKGGDKILFFNRNYLLAFYNEKQKLLEGGNSE